MHGFNIGETGVLFSSCGAIHPHVIEDWRVLKRKEKRYLKQRFDSSGECKIRLMVRFLAPDFPGSVFILRDSEIVKTSTMVNKNYLFFLYFSLIKFFAIVRNPVEAIIQWLDGGGGEKEAWVLFCKGSAENE